MVTVSVQGDRLHFDVQGWDKLWALRSTLDIPLAHVVSVSIDPEPARGWFHGLRVGGTQIPGVMTAGTYYQHGAWVFYDVHDPDNTIVLELDHEHYKKLIVEVSDPPAVTAMIDLAIKQTRS